MAKPGLADVLLVTVISPDGASFRAIEGAIPRTMGTHHDTASVRVFAPSRFKSALEFNGSFVSRKPGDFTRTVLPKPGAGTDLSSAGWKIRVEQPGEGAYEIFPLILIEASVVKWSVADGSKGPFTPDGGQDRYEEWRLALADARILWREMGHVAGKRNWRDKELATRRLIPTERTRITVEAPNLAFESAGSGQNQTVRVKIAEPKKIDFDVLESSDEYDPTSLKAEKSEASGPQYRLRNTKELFEEVLERLPYVTRLDGGALFGPAEMAPIVEKLVPKDLDYGDGTDGAAALEKIAEASGLLIGLELDGSVTVEFDAIPTSTQLARSGVIGRQAKWASEDRGARVLPRAPAARFYPNRVVKEIVLTGFQPVAKSPDGHIQPLGDLAHALGLDGKEGQVALGMALKGEVERAGEKDSLEAKLGLEPGKTTSLEERQIREERVRILADNAFRTYQWDPPSSIFATALAARIASQESFQKDAKSPLELPKDGGKDAPTSKTKISPFNVAAAIDGLVTKPLKQVTRVEGVGDLKPRFMADVLLHRLYDFINQGDIIVKSVFHPTKIIVPGELIDLGFQQTLYDQRINQVSYFGTPKNPAADFKPGTETFPKKPPT